MHPAGRICKLSPMTVLTSASHVKVTPRTAFLKKMLGFRSYIYPPYCVSCASHFNKTQLDDLLTFIFKTILGK